MFLDFNFEIYSWIRGGLLVLFLYHLIIYFQNKRSSYFYYSMFCLCLFIYLLKDIFEGETARQVYLYINYSLQFLAYVSVLSFARYLLLTKERIPFWDRLIDIEIKVLTLLAIGFPIIQYFVGYEIQTNLFILIGILLSVFAIICLFPMGKIEGATPKYYVAGTLIFVIFANLSFLEFFIGKDIYTRNGIEPMFFMYIGVFIQSIINASILGRSVKKIEQKSKNAEIRLAFKYKELEELKMTALQSQMNPHFLFNSLNSINNFILKSDIEKASDYITKFSRLIRVILKSSSSLTVPFSEELGILSLYVKLEQMRINGGFDYIVNIEKDINLEEIKVPPLFLQPFIENSIWHGLTHVEGEKRINLIVSQEEDNIICEIIDNGIGINKAREESHKKINRRKFFGTKATENRIRLLYKKSNVQIDVTDISDEASTGTKVRISFPYIVE